ncbi:hypothetical protein H9L13_02495 [Sphingomonas lutea]|uniref:EF-hand domain-containing protein n=1 Tax=Sphingomonas lutea TaxID=1045317 RepID=A0A7G9SIZ3_9SPHN|nr:hypothetical protein [Sphingomonas lutea]QNN67818.1 hypothetical protein H9L13_02495 [Sphingomonas lutea]
MRWSSLLLAALVATPAAARPVPTEATQASAPIGVAAAQIFERDWVLMNWALKTHDTDRDILLSAREAQAAADAFRAIADGDEDGRVTPTEYRAAREFILARY